jgi:hypothetical protein
VNVAREEADVSFPCFPLTLLVLLAASPSPGIYQQGQARLQVSGTRIDRGVVTLRLSDYLKLKMRVEGGPGLEVDQFTVGAEGKVWAVHRQTKPTVVTPREGHRGWEKEVELNLVAEGKEQKLPEISLRYRDHPGEPWQEVHFKDLPAIQVVVPEEGVRGQLPIEKLPEQPHWTRHLLPGAILLAVAGLAVAGGVLWLRWPRSTAPVVPAHERALHELDRLAQSIPPVKAPPDWYHIQVSTLIRRYLEERFCLRVSSQTTEEFFGEIHRGDLLNSEQQALLHQLLDCCDLAKFSGLLPSPAECSEAGTLARQFVLSTASPAPETPPAHG